MLPWLGPPAPGAPPHRSHNGPPSKSFAARNVWTVTWPPLGPWGTGGGRTGQARDYMVGGGRAAAAELRDLTAPPTAVFAGNDPHAAGVCQVASEKSLRIPDDLSVMGFDNVALCEFLSPPLTTVSEPIMEMAHEAVRLIHRLIDTDERWEGPMVQLSTTLVVRSSTGPAPARRRRQGTSASAGKYE